MADANRIRIFDTTLRDGEQSPGASMNMAEKVEVARALAALGVDIIEAGFPIASQGDFEAVRAIATEVTGATVCGLARCNDRDIDRAWEALQYAQTPRIHVFLATSAIHREHKLKMTRDADHRAGRRRASDAPGRYCADVEFSPEDAARTELDFLCEVVAGRHRGRRHHGQHPRHRRLRHAHAVRRRDPHARASGCRTSTGPIISVHCHNDLGLAVANSLAACEAGARQVECTINGIGERAGNAALEEIVMALKTRFDYYGLTTGIKTERLYPVSRMVSTITGLAVQRNKAIVGRNAFAHESGIHQDGMLKERSTYEIMRPEEVGVPKTDLVLGKHSGRHALRERVDELGYRLNDEQLETLFDDFKALADKKKEVYDEDLVVLIEKHIQDVPAHWSLVSLHTTAGIERAADGDGRIRRPDGEIVQDAAIGDGPVDAIFKAVERVTGVAPTSASSSSGASPQGKDAQGEVTLELEVESDDRSLPRPRRLDRHHRGVGRGLPQRRQRDRHPPRARPAPRGHRPPRRGGVTTIRRPGVSQLPAARSRSPGEWALRSQAGSSTLYLVRGLHRFLPRLEAKSGSIANPN